MLAATMLTDKNTTAVPLLEAGQRLTRAEFERRYEAMPHLKKAELIEGVVYMPSPAKITHGDPHSQIMMWLGVYRAMTPGVQTGDNVTIRLDDPNNTPQPDALLRIEESHGGQSRLSPDDYVEGAPELIVEISSSTADYDLREKREVYQRNGVQEYIVWLIREQKIRWLYLENGIYKPMSPDANGIMRSMVFPGLHLDVNALLNGNLPQTLAQLQAGLGTAEHQAFVAHLQAKAAHADA